jgi:hypothetical protein
VEGEEVAAASYQEIELAFVATRETKDSGRIVAILLVHSKV